MAYRFIVEDKTCCKLSLVEDKTLVNCQRFEWELKIQETLGPQYVLFHSGSHGTLHLIVFLRRDLVWYTSGKYVTSTYLITGCHLYTHGPQACRCPMHTLPTDSTHPGRQYPFFRSIEQQAFRYYQALSSDGTPCNLWISKLFQYLSQIKYYQYCELFQYITSVGFYVIVLNKFVAFRMYF